MPRCTCAGNSCNCLIQAGSNVTVAGKGTASDPYIVSASGGGGGGGSAEWGDITGTLSDQTDLQGALDTKAPLASPVFTGNPTAPTPSTGDNDTSLATTAFVKAQGYLTSVADASTSVKGIVELATSAETVTGTDSARAVTPAGVAATRGRYVGINAQVGTSYALALSDVGKLVVLDNSSPITLSIPDESTVSWPDGAQIDIVQWGDGAVTIVPGSGSILVYGTPSLVTRAQYSAVTLIRVFSGEWLAVGDLA